MKDRALRRHQEFKIKIKKQNLYSSCLGNLLSESRRETLSQNIEKLKKACVFSHFNHNSKKASKKTVQELRHDISMREQLQA